MRRLCVMIATLFYAGYVPVGSGTIGSLIALALYYFLKDNIFIFSTGIFVSLILGFLTAGQAERFFGKKDSGKIIIDDFSGMLISLYLVPHHIFFWVTAFLIYRFFDILKPGPLFRLEGLKGSLGIMADDLMAGICTNIILQICFIIFQALIIS